jgi:hypothetical protein
MRGTRKSNKKANRAILIKRFSIPERSICPSVHIGAKPLAAKLAVKDFGAELKVAPRSLRLHEQSNYRPRRPSGKTLLRENAMNNILKWIAFALFATLAAGTAVGPGAASSLTWRCMILTRSTGRRVDPV